MGWSSGGPVAVDGQTAERHRDPVAFDFGPVDWAVTPGLRAWWAGGDVPDAELDAVHASGEAGVNVTVRPVSQLSRARSLANSRLPMARPKALTPTLHTLMHSLPIKPKLHHLVIPRVRVRMKAVRRHRSRQLGRGPSRTSLPLPTNKVVGIVNPARQLDIDLIRVRVVHRESGDRASDA